MGKRHGKEKDFVAKRFPEVLRVRLEQVKKVKKTISFSLKSKEKCGETLGSLGRR